MINFRRVTLSTKKHAIAILLISIFIIDSLVLYENLQKKYDYLSFLEYFKYLPATLNGFTYFNLLTIREYYNESIIKAMYFLDKNLDISEVHL